MDLATLGPLILHVGVPGALGTFIIWYLLYKHLPQLVETFDKQMTAQQATFKDALKQILDHDKERQALLISKIEDEHADTRSAIERKL